MGDTDDHEDDDDTSSKTFNDTSSDSPTSESFLINTINPYAVLNIAPDATIDEIQKSYKSLSRSFHPDKQPPGRNRTIAQGYFVQFKSSYDILIDPVLRLAYDGQGMPGVRFLTKSPKIYKSIEEQLAQIDPDNNAASKLAKIHQAREILAEALQYHSFNNSTRFQKPSISADITVKCNSTHSGILGEGMDSHLIEVEDTRINMSVTKSPSAKTSLSFGGHSAVSNGQGSSGTQISVHHEPAQGTNINLDLDVGTTPDATKLSFGTTRVLSNQTYVATTLSSSASKDVPLGLAITSHRSMMENKISGTWVMGLVLPKFQLQYGLLSFTSNYPNQPKCTAKFNLGMDYTPVQFIAEKAFDEEERHVGKVACGWGPRGVDMKATTSRYLSQYCKLTIGLHHVSAKGLTWLFQIQRGSIKFTVPILISTIMSPAYAVKSMYMTLVLGMVDASLGDFVQQSIAEVTGKSNSTESKELRREEVLLEREKVKRDAMQQIGLMEKPAQTKRLKEEEKKGLVIISATYSVLGGDSIDVTTALMFWVAKGRLQLPATTKSSMIGFYDVMHDLPVDREIGYINACWKMLEKMWNRDNTLDVGPVEVPILKIRYRYEECLYEIQILDYEPLSLPSSKALKLGGSRVI
jgi:hypothetical protein